MKKFIKQLLCKHQNKNIVNVMYMYDAPFLIAECKCGKYIKQKCSYDDFLRYKRYIDNLKVNKTLP